MHADLAFKVQGVNMLAEACQRPLYSLGVCAMYLRHFCLQPLNLGSAIKTLSNTVWGEKICD